MLKHFFKSFSKLKRDFFEVDLIGMIQLIRMGYLYPLQKI